LLVFEENNFKNQIQIQMTKLKNLMRQTFWKNFFYVKDYLKKFLNAKPNIFASLV
jgi:hypothetical protein